MKSDDEMMVDEIVEAVRIGTVASRAEIASALGFGQTASRLIGLAIRSKRLRLSGRDRFNSPTYEVTNQPSELVAEVCV